MTFYDYKFMQNKSTLYLSDLPQNRKLFMILYKFMMAIH